MENAIMSKLALNAVGASADARKMAFYDIGVGHICQFCIRRGDEDCFSGRRGLLS